MSNMPAGATPTEYEDSTGREEATRSEWCLRCRKWTCAGCGECSGHSECKCEGEQEEPINYGTCSICRREQIGKYHEHPCE